MGERQAQEFWDQMWYWERYEMFPGEQTDDPHLVIQLGVEVDSAQQSGQEPDPEVFRRFDSATGRVLQRLTELFPKSQQAINLDELMLWLRFGLDPNHRGHDGASVPIIDADSLFIFLRFIRYAREYCVRHNLTDLEQAWTEIESAAKAVEDDHQQGSAPSRASRFQPN